MKGIRSGGRDGEERSNFSKKKRKGKINNPQIPGDIEGKFQPAPPVLPLWPIPGGGGSPLQKKKKVIFLRRRQKQTRETRP